jgi:hypothetical protein
VTTTPARSRPASKLQDWHRVERTLARVKNEVSELLAHGWTIEPLSR